MTTPDEGVTCPHCGWEIDENTCWCGSAKFFHPWEAAHTFIPMGCTCGYHDAESRKKVTP